MVLRGSSSTDRRASANASAHLPCRLSTLDLKATASASFGDQLCAIVVIAERVVRGRQIRIELQRPVDGFARLLQPCWTQISEKPERVSVRNAKRCVRQSKSGIELGRALE